MAARQTVHKSIKERHKVYLDGSETNKELYARGLSKATISRAKKRGYYWMNYHECAGSNTDDPGGFAEIKYPYLFAKKYVMRALNILPAEEYRFYRDSVDDLVQDGLLRIWERRHLENNNRFILWAAMRINQTTINTIKKERNRRELMLKYMHPNLHGQR